MNPEDAMMTKDDLVTLHRMLGLLELAMGNIHGYTKADMQAEPIRAIYEVQEMIENLLAEVKRNQKNAGPKLF